MDPPPRQPKGPPPVEGSAPAVLLDLFASSPVSVRAVGRSQRAVVRASVGQPSGVSANRFDPLPRPLPGRPVPRDQSRQHFVERVAHAIHVHKAQEELAEVLGTMKTEKSEDNFKALKRKANAIQQQAIMAVCLTLPHHPRPHQGLMKWASKG